MDRLHRDILFPIFGSILTGAVIGIEREYRSSPAGFRTHILVALSSGLLMLAAVHQVRWLTDTPIDIIRIDPVRMAHGILTGIGFRGGAGHLPGRLQHSRPDRGRFALDHRITGDPARRRLPCSGRHRDHRHRARPRRRPVHRGAAVPEGVRRHNPPPAPGPRGDHSAEVACPAARQFLPPGLLVGTYCRFRPCLTDL